MRFEFLHLADVHLGYQQYGHRERFNDFGRAFERAIDHALKGPVDVVLITGDLFHKSAVDPPTLLQAVHNLDRLRQAEVPVIAIYGNHDQARYRDAISWLDFLAERQYLRLLSPTFTQDGLLLQPWDGIDGAYIDIGPMRFLGVPYLGASLRSVLRGLPDAMEQTASDNVAFSVLMAHAGIEGEMPGLSGGLRHEELAPLRPYVDYVALGHLHKPFDRDGWIFNPGALETCGMDERRWRGGFFHVTVDTDGDPLFETRHVKSVRRPFFRVVLPVDELETPPELYAAARAHLLNAGFTETAGLEPVVELFLEGVLGFDRADLDLDHLKSIVEESTSALVARVRNNSRSTEYEIIPGQDLERGELERAVLKELLLRDARYREHADGWAGTMAQVKSMALTGSTAEEIAGTVRIRLCDTTQAHDKKTASTAQPPESKIDEDHAA